MSGDIPAVSDGGRRLARGIARNLFVADRETHFANLVAFETPELLGDEWTDSAALIPATSRERPNDDRRSPSHEVLAVTRYLVGKLAESLLAIWGVVTIVFS